MQLACNTDDLSHHVLQNSILKTTIDRLIKTDEIDPELREELMGLSASFYGVPTIRIAARDFSRVKLHGNNGLYGLLLRVCELVHESLVPSSASGRFIFRDLLADPQAMGRIFQSFIRNFYKLEQSRFVVGANSYGWPVLKTAGRGHEFLPRMNTDVSLQDSSRTILIECKWTPECFVSNWGTKSLRSDHVYQLHAYIRNHPKVTEGKLVEGFLLYPEVTEPLDVEVLLDGQWMGAHTIDLSKQWPEIHGQLMSLIQYSRGETALTARD